MPGFITAEIVLYTYILLLMIGVAGLGFVAQRLAGKLAEAKNRNSQSEQDLARIREQFAYTQRSLTEKFRSDSLENFINRTGTGMIILTPSGTVSEWNPAAEKITGIAKLDAVIKPLPDLLQLTAGNGQAIAADLISRASAGETLPLPPKTNLKIGEKSIPVSGILSPLPGTETTTGHLVLTFWPDYETLEMINTLADQLATADEKNTRLDLELSKLKHLTGISAAMVELLKIGVISVDRNRNVYALNHTAEIFTGQLDSKIKNQEFSRIFRLTDQKESDINPLLDQALAGKTVTLPKWTFLNSKNGKTPIIGVAAPVNLPELPGGGVIAFRDAEQEYSEEAEEKGFISSAAHDLRAPLTTIRGVVELLYDSYDKMDRNEAMEILKGAKDSVLHLIALVNDLLNVSRLDQGRIVISKKPLPVGSIVSEITESFRAQAREKNLYLNYDPLSNPVPPVSADEMRFKEIITNLISNAIKYTIRGGITITQHADDSMAYITIADTGAGIAPENQRLLFRKFQQVGEARKLSHVKSTGLGLYIAKKFAALMGGDLYLTGSEPEKGSVFELRLPLATTLPEQKD